MDPPVPGAGRGRPGQVVGSGASAEQGVGGYGLNVVASSAGYDDAPDLVEGWTAAIVEGYRGAECADRPAATRVLLDLCPGAGCGVRRAELELGFNLGRRRHRTVVAAGRRVFGSGIRAAVVDREDLARSSRMLAMRRPDHAAAASPAARPANAPPESSGSYRAPGGGLQGCPLRGVRPRRWRMRVSCSNGLRRTRRRGFFARRRDPPRGWSTRARAHRRPSSSIMPFPSFAVAFEHRLAHRAQGKVWVSPQPVQMPRGPRSTSGSPGPRASRYRADAKPGSQPAARSAAATAAARPMPDGISRAAWRWSRPPTRANQRWTCVASAAG